MKDKFFYPIVVVRSAGQKFLCAPVSIDHLSEEFKRNSVFRDAIYLASPVLFTELEKWINGKYADAKSEDRIKRALYKYYNRMSTRCTPFGLFAQVGTANWNGHRSTIRIRNRGKVAKLDSEAAQLVSDTVQKLWFGSDVIKYYLNSSSYYLNGVLRYVEFVEKNGMRQHSITSVDLNEYLGEIIEKSTGGITFDQATQLLINRGINKNSAQKYIHELISSQIIICNWQPALTGRISVLGIGGLAECRALGEDQDISSLIHVLINEIGSASSTSYRELIKFKKIEKAVTDFGAEWRGKNIIQVDSYTKSDPSNLSISIQRKIQVAYDVLSRLYVHKSNPDLERFKASFANKYGERWIPLAIVLDSESGIGYPNRDLNGINTIVDDIKLPNSNKWKPVEWNHIENFLLKILISSIERQQYTVHLSHSDINQFPVSERQMPPTFNVLFKVINSTSNLLTISSIGGFATAASLLGRFSGGDADICNLIKEIYSHEKEVFDEMIVAEIVHLPDVKTANVSYRLLRREFEIPYLAVSTAPLEQQIQLQDLYVTVRNGKVHLLSKKHNRLVVPRLSTAHNYRYNALPIYQFLGDLQFQDNEIENLAFHWGSMSSGFSFLPRLEYDGIILAQATWNLSKIDYQDICARNTSTDLKDKLNNWILKWRLPRRIVLKIGDNELFVDFDCSLSTEVFINEIKDLSAIQLVEYLFDENNSLIVDETNQPIVNEMVATIFNMDYHRSKYYIDKTIDYPIERIFAPGSEWLSLKIYCGANRAENILVTHLLEFVLQQLPRGTNWFFVKYVDSEPHIRFRISSTIEQLQRWQRQLSLMFRSLIECHEISRIEIDSYSREVERYGLTNILAVEAIFRMDSMSALLFLKHTRNDELRLFYALTLVDQSLSLFGFNWSRKLEFVQFVFDSFFKEHHGDSQLKVQLSAKYREHRNQMQDYITGGLMDKELRKILNERLNDIEPYVDIIRTNSGKYEDLPQYEEIVWSIVHMSLNRIFKGKHRLHELVVYFHLKNYYTTLIKRAIRYPME